MPELCPSFSIWRDITIGKWMRYLCDVHISISIAKRIEQLGFHSEHVNHILNKWKTKDSDIADYADQNDLILITKDQDFRNSFLLKNTPKKLVKINLGNISNRDLIRIIDNQLERLNSLSKQAGSFMVEINKDNLWTTIK